MTTARVAPALGGSTFDGPAPRPLIATHHLQGGDAAEAKEAVVVVQLHQPAPPTTTFPLGQLVVVVSDCPKNGALMVLLSLTTS